MTKREAIRGVAVIGIAATGFFLIGSWHVAAGVFLLIWANNIERSSRH